MCRRFLGTLLLVAVGSCAARDGSGCDDPTKVLLWLSAQQDPVTGLLPSQQDELASTYANALAVIAFTLEGRAEAAERILDHYAGRCDATEFFVLGEPRGFFQYRSSRTGQVDPSSNRWMGDNAWLAVAIAFFHRTTGRTTYDYVGEQLIGLLRHLQQPEGYVASGWEEGDTRLNLSGHAEGNLDAYKALALYGEMEAASQVKAWLDHTDLGWRHESLDLHSWRVLSLGPSYGFAVLDTDPLQRSISHGGQNVLGFVPQPSVGDNIWTEGTAQMAVAYYEAGYATAGDLYRDELAKLLFEPAEHPGTCALAYFPQPEPNHAWVDPTRGHVAAASWYLFALRGFDPFDGVVVLSSPRANPTCQLEAENYEQASSAGVRGDDRGVLSEGLALHVAGDNDTAGDDNAWLTYRFKTLSPIPSAVIRLRYADEVAGDRCVIWLDDWLAATFDTQRTGTWDDLVWSEDLAVGALEEGSHTLRIEFQDNGSYGLTLDVLRVDG